MTRVWGGTLEGKGARVLLGIERMLHVGLAGLREGAAGQRNEPLSNASLIVFPRNEPLSNASLIVFPRYGFARFSDTPTPNDAISLSTSFLGAQASASGHEASTGDRGAKLQEFDVVDASPWDGECPESSPLCCE